MEQAFDWATVAAAAEKLGVKKVALLKWRQRGIPHRWRLPLIREGAVSPEAFDPPKEAAE